MTPLDIINILSKARASEVRELLEDWEKNLPEMYETVAILAAKILQKLNLQLSDIRP